MKNLFTRLMIMGNKLICGLWGIDPHEWTPSSYYKGQMVRLSIDGQSFEYRGMDDEEKEKAAWDQAIK